MDYAEMASSCELALMWLGFGTLVGFIAKGLLPGRDPGGPITTVMMGIAGTLIGCAVLQFASQNAAVKPVSVEGCTVGIIGAVVLLISYKILGGHWFDETESGRRRRRRQYEALFDED